MQLSMASFSKSQKRIADYIINHYDKAAFMTASKLGDKINVSESTVVRFAAELGYDGYPAMQKALQEIIRNKLTAVQ
ncbi:MAG: N-acetylmannosamine kinase, partial [Clostridia bacterium]